MAECDNKTHVRNDHKCSSPSAWSCMASGSSVPRDDHFDVKRVDETGTGKGIAEVGVTRPIRVK